MKKMMILLPAFLITAVSIAQRTETVYLDAKDSTANMYIAVIPEDKPVNSFMFLLDGFGNSPQGLLVQTDLPKEAANQGILTIIPILKTGSLYFGSDTASQQSLKEMIDLIAATYKLKDKRFYIGGFSIGGTCAVKYAELAVQKEYPIKPTALFAVDPPLDWERFYNSAKRVVRLSKPGTVNGEVTYMIERIQKEMGGVPELAPENYYNGSPYSYNDTTQRNSRALVKTPVRIITEPDIQWWLNQRGYDLSYTNMFDHTAMINELKRLGNDKAVLITTTNKGYRRPENNRHPHSWSIADPKETIEWLKAQE